MTTYVGCSADTTVAAHNVYRLTFAMTSPLQIVFPLAVQAHDFDTGMTAIYDAMQHGTIAGMIPLTDNPSGSGEPAGTVDVLITPRGDGRRLGNIVDALTQSSKALFGLLSGFVGVATVQKITIQASQGINGESGRARATQEATANQPSLGKSVWDVGQVITVVAAVVLIGWGVTKLPKRDRTNVV